MEVPVLSDLLSISLETLSDVLSSGTLAKKMEEEKLLESRDLFQ